MLISQWFQPLSYNLELLPEPLGTAGPPTTPDSHLNIQFGKLDLSQNISQDISQGYVNIYDAIPFVCQCKNSS